MKKHKLIVTTTAKKPTTKKKILAFLKKDPELGKLPKPMIEHMADVTHEFSCAVFDTAKELKDVYEENMELQNTVVLLLKQLVKQEVANLKEEEE